jgi:hypothetical protein
MPSKQEKREVVNSTKGFSSSLFIHSLLILIGISPLATFKAPIWEEEQPGMEVALDFLMKGKEMTNLRPVIMNREDCLLQVIHQHQQLLRPSRNDFTINFFICHRACIDQ